MRNNIKKLVQSLPFEVAVLVLIVINTILLSIEFYPEITAVKKQSLILADSIIIWAFVLELLLRIYAYGSKFFNRFWNIFDFLIITIAILPEHHIISAFRILRFLDYLYLIHIFRALIKFFRNDDKK